MNISIRNKSESGFAILESLLILVIISGIVGIGAYVEHQKSVAKASLEATTSTTQTSASKETVVKPATALKLTAVNSSTADITNLVTTESDTETTLNKTADGDTLSNINDSNKAATNLGDSFNENDL